MIKEYEKLREEIFIHKDKIVEIMVKSRFEEDQSDEYQIYTTTLNDYNSYLTRMISILDHKMSKLKQDSK